MIVAVNAGSSSVKFAVFDAPTLHRRLSGHAERIGQAGASLALRFNGSGGTERRELSAGGIDAAVEAVVATVKVQARGHAVTAIGHRVVHGGPRLLEHQIITTHVLDELQAASPLDPAHLPAAIRLIEACGVAFPGVPQYACFDTAFHRDMPAVAQMLPIPRRFLRAGVRRYGFHGLSYTYLMQRLEETAGPAAANGRVILAHLGSGASMAAVRGGRAIDTTMAFTPTAGLVMGTRPGDLDPGLLSYLIRSGAVTPDGLDHFINKECGLLGVSETSADVRDLVARRADDPRAADAIDLFCYQARKHIGALTATLGGLDTLVFSGGIGEHSAVVRSQICAGLEHLGVVLEEHKNAAGNGEISAGAGASASQMPVSVRVIATDEEQVIAQFVRSRCSPGE
ncbi:MAG: acetate/propionate family kinase [Phycisphaerales bacterium]|nr:acetate/propionate family kinase [Phycisphaerales bacterium]